MTADSRLVRVTLQTITLRRRRIDAIYSSFALRIEMKTALESSED